MEGSGGSGEWGGGSVGSDGSKGGRGRGVMSEDDREKRALECLLTLIRDPADLVHNYSSPKVHSLFV